MNAIIASANSMFQDGRVRIVLAVAAAITLALVFAFWEGLANLLYRWGNQQELSHSYFLPVIAAWFLYERRSALRESAGRANLLGLLPLAFGVFLLFLGTLTHILVLVHLGLVVSLLAMPLLFGGWSLLAVSIVPLAYLFFMVPPPYWVITRLSGGFQLMSSELGVAMIRLFGIPVWLSGNVIHLSSATLAVVEACSGLRYLFPFLSLGALAGYLYRGPIWQRVAIFLATVPITILMNSFRIALTGVLVENYGESHTEGMLHLLEGWVVFLLCCLMLAGLIWIFTLLRGEKGPFTFVGVETVKPVRPRRPFETPAFVRAGIAATVLILAGGVMANGFAQRSIVIPDRQDFSTLPFEFPEWRSKQAVLSADVENTLGADDYIISDMIGPEGEVVNLYVAYYDAQRDGRSWHSPRQCLPGGGWVISEHDILTDTRADGSEWHYNRLVIDEGEKRYVVNYWYDQRGRKIANEFVMKFSVMWDSLARRRSDGSMVRLMTPVMPGESVEEADAILRDMRHDLEKKLLPYVPV